MRMGSKTGGGAGTTRDIHGVVHVKGTSKQRGRNTGGLSAPTLVLTSDLLNGTARTIPDHMVGSAVSWGATGNHALGQALISALGYADRELAEERQAMWRRLGADDPYRANHGPQAEAVSELVTQLVTDLDEVAPEGTFFGSRDTADGPAYGFWPAD